MNKIRRLARESLPIEERMTALSYCDEAYKSAWSDFPFVEQTIAMWLQRSMLTVQQREFHY